MIQPDRSIVEIEDQIPTVHQMEHALNPHFFNAINWARAYDQLTNNLDASPARYATDAFSVPHALWVGRWGEGRECEHLYMALLHGTLRAYNAFDFLSDSIKSEIKQRIEQALGWATLWPQMENFREIDLTQRPYEPPESNLARTMLYFTVAREIVRRNDADNQWYLWELARNGLKTVAGNEKGSEVAEQLLGDILTRDTLIPEDPELKTLATLMAHTEIHIISNGTASGAADRYIQRIIQFFPPEDQRGHLALQRVMDILVSPAHPAQSLRFIEELLDSESPVIREQAETLFRSFIRISPEEVDALVSRLLQSDNPYKHNVACDMVQYISHCQM